MPLRARRRPTWLTVELDSYRFHNTRHAFEQDAYARSDAFRRYTRGDLYEHPEQMLAELAELLASSREAAGPADPAGAQAEAAAAARRPRAAA